MNKKIISLFVALPFLLSQLSADPIAPVVPPQHPVIPPSNFVPPNVPAPNPSQDNTPTDPSTSNTDLPVNNQPPENTPPVLNPLPGTAALIGLSPNDNSPLPIDLESDIARLLVLEDAPVVAADGSAPFAVTADVYTSLLNLFATDDPSQQIMYTIGVQPYIEQHADLNGNFSYTTIPGQENTLLGYSHCLSAITFRDVLCKDQNTFFTLDANVDSNQQTYFWVHFNTVYFTDDDGSDNGLTHYQWINHTGTGNYYDFYLTKDHPDLSQFIPNSSNLCVRSFTGNVWVGSRDDSNQTHDWTVTGNSSAGLSTSADGSAFVQAPDNSAPAQDNPATPPTDSNAPAQKNISSWDDYLQNGAGSSWELYQASKQPPAQPATQAPSAPSN